MAFLRTTTILLLAFASLGLGEPPVMVTADYFGTKTPVPVAIAKPDGPGPFSAVVWMHDCSGLGALPFALRPQWTERLTKWGYLVAIPDSFTPRGKPAGVCAEVMAVDPSGPRVADAFATLRYLQTRRDVIPTAIGIQGHSHGGQTVFTAVQGRQAEFYAQQGRPGFAAAVAYYPYCFAAPTYPIAEPLLLLIGEADDWTPASLCEVAAENAGKPAPPFTLHVYPGALHAFDNERLPPTTYLGYRIGHDPQAAADSFARTQAFYEQYLKGRSAR